MRSTVHCLHSSRITIVGHSRKASSKDRFRLSSKQLCWDRDVRTFALPHIMLSYVLFSSSTPLDLVIPLSNQGLNEKIQE